MNSKNSFFTAIFLFVASSITAQSSNLVGTWHLDINKAIAAMDQKYKIEYDSLPMDIKERAISRMNGREFIFFENGEIKVNWKSHKEPQVSNGQWLINESQKSLSIIINNQTSEYNYEFISTGVLIMRAKNKRGFFDNLYLLKVN